MTQNSPAIDWDKVHRTLEQNQRRLSASLSIDKARLDDTFHRRAVELAQRHVAVQRGEKALPLLVFSLGTESYGIDLTNVVAVFAAAACTPVPGGPPQLYGVANFDGDIYSLLDLRPLTGRVVDVDGPQAAPYAVLIRSGETRLGLRVDALPSVQHVAPARMVPALGTAGNERALVRSIADDRINVLDPAALCESASCATGSA